MSVETFDYSKTVTPSIIGAEGDLTAREQAAYHSGMAAGIGTLASTLGMLCLVAIAAGKDIPTDVLLGVGERGATVAEGAIAAVEALLGKPAESGEALTVEQVENLPVGAELVENAPRTYEDGRDVYVWRKAEHGWFVTHINGEATNNPEPTGLGFDKGHVNPVRTFDDSTFYAN